MAVGRVSRNTTRAEGLVGVDRRRVGQTRFVDLPKSAPSPNHLRQAGSTRRQMDDGPPLPVDETQVFVAELCSTMKVKC